MATLKSLVDETSNIKNELKTCHTNLKNNLSAKGIGVSSSDKIPSLINKINDITLSSLGGKRFATGEFTSQDLSFFKSSNGYNGCIDVRNLDFKPNLIMCHPKKCDNYYLNKFIVIYNSQYSTKNFQYIKWGDNNNSAGGSEYSLSSKNSSIYNDGFTLFITVSSSASSSSIETHTWIAIE